MSVIAIWVIVALIDPLRGRGRVSVEREDGPPALPLRSR
jgi:hypothetical protein